GRAPVFLDANIAAVDPAELLERLAKRRAACTCLRLVGKCTREVNEARHAARLLGAYGKRPRGRCPAEQHDELAASCMSGKEQCEGGQGLSRHSSAPVATGSPQAPRMSNRE